MNGHPDTMSKCAFLGVKVLRIEQLALREDVISFSLKAEDGTPTDLAVVLDDDAMVMGLEQCLKIRKARRARQRGTGSGTENSPPEAYPPTTAG